MAETTLAGAMEKSIQLDKQIKISDKEYETLRTVYLDTLEQLDHKTKLVDALQLEIADLKGSQNKEFLQMQESLNNKEIEINQKIEKIKLKYKNYTDDLKKEIFLSNQINQRMQRYIDSIK
mmetsp:Transcript_16706/g.19355  ORF Transcript_16706/g.19355 Transcript_16706/m.19355 type:complete len:121 (+) Transcript_16706:922-1284(+)